MKNRFTILFFLISTVVFSQKKVIKKFETKAVEIEISTLGLDDFVLENSNSKFIEITLFAEVSEAQYVFFDTKNNVSKIEFKFNQSQTDETIFRKFITERLKRANAIIKVPKGKKVTIFGENIDIESKSVKNNLEIYIENGIVKLNEIQQNTILKLYSGNVYGTPKDLNINVISRIGKIKIDSIFYNKKYQKKSKKHSKKLIIKSIKANIFLE
jgi:hypothetical protein